MNNKKILYCMHVGWNWIKQRPQFIAEELSNYYDVTVISEHSYRVRSVDNKSSETNTLHIKEFYKIPLLDHSQKLVKINNFLRKIYIKYQIRIIQPDYLYVMSPRMISYIPKKMNRTIIIYDCMDNMVEFAKIEKKKEEIIREERDLIYKSDVIFFSSQHLLNEIKNRYRISDNKRTYLVRNAYNGRLYNPTIDYKKRKCYTLCYFGTIARWFNFEFFLRLFNEIENIKLLLIGPLQSGTRIPNNSNIEYIGSVPHDELEKYIIDVDSFAMPFVVDRLIESVDPVKLYEYINYFKNILCVRYAEVERFEKFVFFYSDYSSFKSQIVNMMNRENVKYSAKERLEFLNDNTWIKRAENMKQMLENTYI